MADRNDNISVFHDCLIVLSVAALAGIVVMLSGDLTARGQPLDCPAGIDCPPSEHASENARPPSSITAGMAKTRKMGPDSCGSPFRRVTEPGSEGKPAAPKCVLDQDATLNETIEVSSFTVLDCQGHKLTPSRVGTNITWPSGRSAPEAAIFFKEAYGIEIKNCIIEGFDFGIFGINSKVPENARDNPAALALLENGIRHNRVNARFLGISLISVDNTEISENDVTVNTLGSLGLSISRNSDINRVTDNNITGNFTNKSGTARVPGPIVGASPLFVNSFGVSMIHTAGGEPTLFTMILGGDLYQFPIANTSVTDGNFSEDNLFEGNYVSFPQTRAVGIILATAQRANVSNNTIERPTLGMQPGGILGIGIMGQRQFPGTCTLNASRLCLANSECAIPGFDTASQGNCTLPPVQNVSWPARGLLIEDNRILNPSTAGVITNSRDLVFRGNTIVGGPLGISLVGPFPLETATVERNNFTNVTEPLRMEKTFNGLVTSFFGARISLNDFRGYTNAVRTTNDFNLSANLSASGKGNHWGISSCPAFDPAKVKFDNGAANPSVVDDHPYNVSVANTPDGSLPAACP